MTTVIIGPDSGYDHKIIAQAVTQGQLTEIHAVDHLGGFNENYENNTLGLINSVASTQHSRIATHTSYIFDNIVLQNYANLDFKHKFFKLLHSFKDYRQHPEIDYKNFICSFNGTAHVSRKLLVAILKKFGWFNTEFCSKNFCYSSDMIDGHVSDYVGTDQFQLYNKFFLNDEIFNQSLATFGHDRFNHSSNIYNLEHKLTKSFLHVVSETMATSYYPFVTEKFLYSIVTRGLFLAYAQPCWHDHVEKYYGFRRYDRIFDYGFDDIQNPVERLVELMSMISKFSVLSTDDWHDLYQLESDTVEYNYDHYFSGDYLKALQLHA